jgi:hypothetical protein
MYKGFCVQSDHNIVFTSRSVMQTNCVTANTGFAESCFKICLPHTTGSKMRPAFAFAPAVGVSVRALSLLYK